MVYGGEIDQLRLQARSIARHLDPEAIGAILVIVNDRDEDACVARVTAMLPEYGPHAARVEILRPAALFARRPARFAPRGLGARARAWFTANRWRYPAAVKGGWRGNRGWSVQQALKLAVARHGSGTHLLILDAKNHFIRPVSRSSFVAPDGCARTFLQPPTPKHWQWIEGSFQLLSLPVPGREVPSPPTVTPFVIGRGTLLDCLETIEARVGPVETFFARKRSEQSEFALIHAAIIARHGQLMPPFAPGLVPAATLHRNNDDAMIDRTLAFAESGGAEILSVHSSRRGRLSPEQIGRLEALWSTRGLDAHELLAVLDPGRPQLP